jgi:peptidoglycan/LPS O-acetylase OafA/YrhL
LDGLRAVAVLLVLGFHGSQTLPGGWIGVTVFFVISGFLITRLLLVEFTDTGRIDLLSFFIRRGLRLFPALAAAIVVCGAVIALVPADRLAVDAWVAVASTATYTANWLEVFHPEGAGPLIHTWTLSIEEQFYLVWPPCLLALLVHRQSVDRVLSILVVALIALVAFRAGFSQIPDDPRQLWFATTTHADSLVIGCILGTLHDLDRLPAINAAAASAAFGCLVVCALLLDQFTDFAYYGGLTLVALIAAVLLAHVVTSPASGVTRVFSSQGLKTIGQRSYGLYLFHFPVFFWVQQTDLAGSRAYFAELTLSAALTALSYRFVERPALLFKERLHARVDPLGAPRRPW